MSRCPLSVPLIIVTTLGVVYAGQEVALRRERAQLGSLRERTGEPVSPATLAASPPGGATGGKTVARTQPAPSPAQTEPKAQKTGKQPGPDKRLMAIVNSLRDNPVFRRVVRAQAQRHVDKTYASLYRQLRLAEATPLSDLLKRKVAVGVEASMAIEFGDLSREERRQVMRAAAKAEQAIESEIEKLLGPEGYDVYQDYVQTLPEREQVGLFKEKLFSAGLDLAPSQEDALVALMHEARGAPLTVEENPEVYSLSTHLPEERGLKPEQMELKRMEVIHQRYLDIAASVLTPDQLIVYEEYLNQMQDVWSTHAECWPSPDVESHDRAPAEVGRDATLSGPVTVSAASSKPQQWGDVRGGSSSTVYQTEGNMLGARFDVGSGWGSGLTFWPESAVMNEDKSVNASGSQRLTARLKAPAGVRVRFGLLESGVDWPTAGSFPGANSADGEAFRHEGVLTQDGWQTYSIPLSELKINGGYGNQKGNRVIDTQAIKGIEILVPGGQPGCDMEIDWVRLE